MRKIDPLWLVDEKLIENEIRERLRLGGLLDTDDKLPNSEWFENWTSCFMKKLEKSVEKNVTPRHSREGESTLCGKL